MPNIIAIETSTELASVALLRNEQVISRASSGVQTHSQSVLPMVQTLLAETGISLAQCDAIAFGAGPGSFTGVRTACGVAQGMAFGAGLPVVPIVTLVAMAQARHEIDGTPDVLAILDARMEEVYWAQYRYADGWQTIIEPTLSAAQAVKPVGDVMACGNGLSVYESIFQAQPYFKTARPDMMPHATQIARLAGIAYSRGQAVAADQAQPLYLRNKVAFTTAERQAKAEA